MPEKIVRNTVTGLVVILAGAMVIGGIWGLYELRAAHRFEFVLFLLSVLIVVFAIFMKSATTASRPELFGATAAYAAVLVVFVAVQAPGIDHHFRFTLNGNTGGEGTISG